MSDDIAEAATLLTGRDRILIFTGAGISTESGIPDFRGPSGVWKSANPDDFTLSNYVGNADFRKAAWERRFESPLRHAEPNPAHLAIADLWESNRMIGCVTQNIDGLHQKAGLPDRAIVELHGNTRGIRCMDCGTDADPGDVEARWRSGEADPVCAICGGILKSMVVYFGEMLPTRALATAAAWSADADAVISIGSTLSVYPAASVPLDVASRGAPFVIVNDGPTDHDGVAAVRLEGRAGTLLPQLVAELTA
jgi:NAD-dependent deacetylase